jgi:isopentenyl-diphosphate delta-isomerase
MSHDERVILVDDDDTPTGTSEKIRAHVDGLRHRAFSIFLFNQSGRLLLQRRALGKYHSGGLWSNTCCGHPRPGEAVADAARRRLQQELGMHSTLAPVMRIGYRVEVPENLIEDEFNHVLFGRTEESPFPDAAEIMDVRWMDTEQLMHEMSASPALYSVWFKLLLPPLLAHLDVEKGLAVGRQ